MKTSLELKVINFSYDGKKKVLKKISLKINPGDFICILGPNASGKSTLLKCMSRLNRVIDDSIFINGKDINGFKNNEIAKKIAFLPHVHQFSFPYKVLDLVLMGRTPYLKYFEKPSKKDKEIAIDAMKRIGILSLKDRLHTELSGGQLQLVMLARSLTQESEILLLDEPTSHLDLANQVKILNIIKMLSEQGISIIMASHFPGHAFVSSGFVGLIKEGKLIAYGNADEVVTERNLKKTYGLDIRIVRIDNGVNRKICIPIW